MSHIISGFLFDITASLTAISILFVTVMWAMLWIYKFTVPTFEMARIFTIAFSLQLLLYVCFSFLVVDIVVRSYLVRTSIVVICLSQAIPLWYSYHLWRRNK